MSVPTASPARFPYREHRTLAELDTPRKRGRPLTWSPEDDALLMQGRADGLTYAQIAVMLRRNPGCCGNHARTLWRNQIMNNRSNKGSDGRRVEIVNSVHSGSSIEGAQRNHG